MRFNELPPELADAPRPVLKALLHPYRRQLLRALRQVRVLSAVEVAKSGLLPCGVSDAAYHLTVLTDVGLAHREPPAPDGGPFRYSKLDSLPVQPLVRFLYRTKDEDQKRIETGRLRGPLDEA